MKETHVPNTFERLDQGSRARAAQLDKFRQAQIDFAREGLVVVPQENPGGLWVPRGVLPVAVALELLAIACAPAAAKEQNPLTLPTPVATATSEATATATATSEPTPTPAISPAETAIKEGRIDIKEPQEWEKYFTMVSVAEAREMLAKAKEKGEFKYLLPFDPRKSPNLVMENFDVPLTPDGSRRSIGLGLKNVALGTVFYAPVDGIAEMSRGTSGKDLFGGWSVRTDGDVYLFSFRREGPTHIQKTSLPYDTPTAVEIGTSLVIVDTKETFKDIFSGYQAYGGVARSARRLTDGLTHQLFTKDGKVAFLSVPAGK